MIMAAQPTSVTKHPKLTRICAVVCFSVRDCSGPETNAIVGCAAGGESYGTAVCKRSAVAAGGRAHTVEGAVRYRGHGSRVGLPAGLSEVDPTRRGPGRVCSMLSFSSFQTTPSSPSVGESTASRECPRSSGRIFERT
eukprot:COSAG02_NODE_252_length_26996_cov_29.825607_5_plen_138_part_00